MSDAKKTSGDRHTPPKTTFSTKFFYGFGSVAYGVKDNGFAFFLLFFYSQVLGLSPQLAGLGIMIALVIDAISDPVVGRISDGFHSKWGRRHPFMYGAALPIAVSYFFLWNPPADLSQMQLFAYFVVMAVLVRTCITLYEIPSSALVAELTDNYDERTSFLSYRYFFGWWGGLGMAVFAYMIFLAPTEEFPVGVLNESGYFNYSLTASCLMLFAVLTSCLGTHKYIPYLRKPPAKQSFSLARTASELKETLLERSFMVLFVAGFFAAMSAGLSSSMDIYLNTFYWGFTSTQLGMMSMGYFLSAIIALVIAPIVGKKFNKKSGAIVIAAFAAIIAPMPYVLRMLDMFPENGTETLFYTLLSIRIVDIALIIASSILIASMIADVVEQSEIKTGRRSEGLFFAARNFIAKSVSGVGVLIATSILTVIEFPEGAKPGEVAPEIIYDMGLYFAPLSFVVYMTSILILFAYKISRETHLENLRLLQEEDTSATHWN